MTPDPTACRCGHSRGMHEITSVCGNTWEEGLTGIVYYRGECGLCSCPRYDRAEQHEVPA